MPRIARNYWPFYLDGYEDRMIPTKGIDVDAIALKALDSDQVLSDVIHAACVEHAIALQAPAKKRQWAARNEKAIADAGGDADAAYAAWVHGRVDLLAFSLMPDVVDAISAQVDPEQDDDDDDDDDGEGDEDDGEGDEDEDD